MGLNNEHFNCPCCGYPTLTSSGDFEICFLCYWEDDGQNDFEADFVAGGPNKDYSLMEARKNFNKYLIMYRPSDPDFKRLKNKKIDELKMQIISIFKNSNIKEIKSQYDRIKELEHKLDIEVDKQREKIKRALK